MRVPVHATIAAVFVVLAACDDGGRLSSADASRNAAFGANPRGEGVDGLLVGHRLMEAGEYELALKAYLRGAAENGMSVDVLSALGSANLQLGRLGQSEQLLRRAVEIDPSFVPAINNLGVVLMERGKYAEAKEYFEQAYAADSGETDSIRENLQRAIAQLEKPVYEQSDEPVLYELIRRGEDDLETLNSL
jgi:tetratricopeptide (TPR) repeat protein